VKKMLHVWDSMIVVVAVYEVRIVKNRNRIDLMMVQMMMMRVMMRMAVVDRCMMVV
jgi:hypothetical protein